MFERYAIFHTERAGALADFGAAWLGWDSAAGAARAHPGLGSLDVAALTGVPRNYGFHATLKPPFRLAAGETAEALAGAVAALAARQAPVAIDGLRLADLGKFVALVPEGDTRALEGLAAAVVTGLDRFRGPQSAADLARRRAAGLTARQEAYLAQWGYPYVLGEFRFHMTLTGALPDALRGQVVAALAPVLGPLLPRPHIIDALTLMGQDADGMFRQIHRYALTG